MITKDKNKLKSDAYKWSFDDLEGRINDLQEELKILRKIKKERAKDGEKVTESDTENDKNESKNEQKVTQNGHENESENAHFANGNESSFNPHSQLAPPWGS